MAGTWDGSSTSSSTSRPIRTCEAPAKPSAGSARSTVWPWGSRIPSFGRISTRAFNRRRGGRWRLRVEILISDFEKVTVEDQVELPRLP